MTTTARDTTETPTCAVGCDRCRRVWRVPADYLGRPTVQRFHYCAGAAETPRQRQVRATDRPGPDRGAVFLALLATLGDDVLLRPTDGEGR